MELLAEDNIVAGESVLTPHRRVARSETGRVLAPLGTNGFNHAFGLGKSDLPRQVEFAQFRVQGHYLDEVAGHR